jgi:hypothetical protein
MTGKFQVQAMIYIIPKLLMIKSEDPSQSYYYSHKFLIFLISDIYIYIRQVVGAVRALVSYTVYPGHEEKYH